MLSLGTITVVGVVVLAALLWFFVRTRRQDLLSAMMEKRRQQGARLIARADYMEGMERIPVALALTADTFYYENPDLEASFELARVDEVEYDSELMTGKNLEDGERVLRLRSHGATFEFILVEADFAKWQSGLPPRQLGRPAAANG